MLFDKTKIKKILKNEDMVAFFRTNEVYGCFSQWWISEMIIDDIKYNCCEQYMMAMKAKLFNDETTLREIMAESSPDRLKKLGRKVKGFDSVVWDKHKYDIVLKGNLAKFSQNEGLKRKLLGTGDKVLIEASPYDNVWGVKLSKSNSNIKEVDKWLGSNLLGFALMEVREIIKNK